MIGRGAGNRRQSIHKHPEETRPQTQNYKILEHSSLLFCCQAGWKPPAEYKKTRRARKNTDRRSQTVRGFMQCLLLPGGLETGGRVQTKKKAHIQNPIYCSYALLDGSRPRARWRAWRCAPFALYYTHIYIYIYIYIKRERDTLI